MMGLKSPAALKEAGFPALHGVLVCLCFATGPNGGPTHAFGFMEIWPNGDDSVMSIC